MQLPEECTGNAGCHFPFARVYGTVYLTRARLPTKRWALRRRTAKHLATKVYSGVEESDPSLSPASSK